MAEIELDVKIKSGMGELINSTPDKADVGTSQDILINSAIKKFDLIIDSVKDFSEKKFPEEARRIAGLIDNKLRLKNRAFVSRKIPHVTSKEDYLGQVLGLLLDNIGLPSDIDSLQELQQQLQNGSALKYIKEKYNYFKNSLDTYKSENKVPSEGTLDYFLKNPSVYANFDEKQQALIKNAFPALFGNLGRYKSYAQALSHYKTKMRDKTFRDKVLLNNKFQRIKFFSINAQLRKYETLLNYHTLDPVDFNSRIYTAISNELNRRSAFYDSAPVKANVEKIIAEEEERKYQNSIKGILERLSENENSISGKISRIFLSHPKTIDAIRSEAISKSNFFLGGGSWTSTGDITVTYNDETKLRHILLHELTHHFSVPYMHTFYHKGLHDKEWYDKNPERLTSFDNDPYQDGKYFFDKLTESEVDNLKRIDKIFQHVVDLNKEGKLSFETNKLNYGNPEYGLTNSLEFVAEVLANPYFAAKIAEVPSLYNKKSNLLKDLISALFRMFGIENNQSLLDDVYGLFEDTFLNKDDKYIFGDGLSKSKDQSSSFFQLEQQSSRVPDANLNQKIKNFLASIGIRYQAVEGLKDREGNPLSAIAMADMLNKVINVVEGRADITTLPEEAAHFFVEMLGENHPLYKEMFKQITGYKIYTEVVNTYKNNKLYRNADGTINFNKLKKEAIGKLIMANIISQDSMEENPVKDLMAEKWWKKVWERIKAILGLAPKREGAIENPFATAARQILSNDTTGLSSENLGDDIFLQQYETVGEAVFMRMLADQDRIVLSDEEKHIYTVDGKQITDTVDGEVKGRSITENIVKPWYKRMFPIDRRDDAQKAIDQMKAEYGIGIHKLIDDIVRRYVDRNTGLLKKVPSELPKNEYNSEVNAKLDAYVRSLLYSYPEGTRFLSEVKIYNKKKNLPGTVDIVAIQKDGVVDVLDWKSQEIGANETDLKWFKEPAYRLQLEVYVQTLADDYGVLKFGKIRAIPIRTVFKFVKLSTNKWAPSSLKDIEIGPLDPSLLPDSKNYLMPVVAKNESTGDEMLDKLIVKLNGIYEKLAVKSTKDKERKYEELSKLLNTIRSLQVKRSIDNFVAIGNFEIDKYNDKLDSLSINEIMQAIEIMNVYSDGATYLMDQLRKLKTQILNEKDEKVKEQLEERQTNFTKMALNAQYMVKKLEDKANELTAEVAQNEGVRGILNPERVMDYLKRNFKSLSKLETASAQLLNKLLTKTRQQRDIEIDDKFEKLGELRTKLMKWANDKGIAVEKMFDGILDGTNFLNLYSSEFLEERKRAYKRSDIQWIKDNMEFTPEMKEKYKEDFKRYKEYIESDKYSSDPKEDKEKKNAKILKWIEMNNPEESQIALLNSKNRYLKPKSIHLSEKYKDLLKPENAPLKEVYDYFQALLLDSQKAGMIEYEFGFLPSMHKSKLEALVFGDFKGLGTASNLLSSLSVDSANVFGNIDPVSGEPILDIPVYFTKDLGEDKSLDLFKVFGVWAAQTANYKAMSANEEVAKVILFVERNKGSLQTNMYGNVKPDSKINTNDINAKILERHINYHIYGKKIDLAEDKIVKVFGKEISLTRGLQKMMHYYSMNVLALNPISGTASLFGGTVNAAFIASKRAYFDDKDWAGGMIDFGRKDELSHAFLDFVSPELEDTTYRRARQLSVSQAVQKINAEDLFTFQRYSDKLVIKPVALAMFRSHMLDENNKIVYIPDYVKSKNNYENFYNLSSVERKQVQDKMNKEIEELKKTKSLKAVSKIENDKFVIEGLDRNSDEITKFRAKIRKVNKTIIGNSTQEDINNVRIGILGQAFMQFRSWIPDMVTERFGDLSYDGELETYTYGKMRTFVKHLLDKRALPLIAELAIGFGENTIEKAKERYKEMVQRKQQEGDIDFPNRMSESQFIDMYIGNLRSSMRELLLILSFLVILAYLGGGDDDEKRKKTGSEKFVNRLLDKYFNELAFFYSPSETKQLIKSPLPLLGFLDNLTNFFKHSFGQSMGFVLSDEEAMKESYPAKYFLKAFPIAKVGVDVGGLFDDEFRKEFGIK